MKKEIKIFLTILAIAVSTVLIDMFIKNRKIDSLIIAKDISFDLLYELTNDTLNIKPDVIIYNSDDKYEYFLIVIDSLPNNKVFKTKIAVSKKNNNVFMVNN